MLAYYAGYINIMSANEAILVVCVCFLSVSTHPESGAPHNGFAVAPLSGSNGSMPSNSLNLRVYSIAIITYPA